MKKGDELKKYLRGKLKEFVKNKRGRKTKKTYEIENREIRKGRRNKLRESVREDELVELLVENKDH